MRLPALLRSFVILAPLLALAGTAHATMMHLDATPAATSAGIGSFSVVYDDTGDGLLQFSEILSFSGVAMIPPALASPATFASIAYVPDIAGHATTNCFVGLPSCASYLWVLGPQPSVQSHQLRWTYESGEVTAAGYEPPTAVPEPSAVMLLGLGLVGLWATRCIASRRRRRPLHSHGC